ncbi:N-acetylmuramoyl-L-alanine amidase [Lysobacter solisilvae]|uniref:N-acetylmuramoyl-L-alanine amidase AmiC n=2 Tax=Agrilutibacter solisilvae TaxID=2763317 RepID=A0A974Y2D0_9GAMM|nr:N-acetylmuramoyl-L-alanine amidase [Lysobacter solisilvae]
MMGLALLSALAWNLAQASEIKGLQITAGATGTRAEIALDQPGAFKVIRLSNPERLVLDFTGSRMARNVAMPAGTGVVRAIRSGQPEAGIARLVFDLSQPVAAIGPRLEQGAGGPRLVLEWPGEFASPNAAPAVTTTTTAPRPVDAAATPSKYLPSPAQIARSEAETSAASAEATSRLISQLAQRGTATPTSASGTPATTTDPRATVPPSVRTVPVAAGSISAAPDRSTVYVPPARAASVAPAGVGSSIPTPARAGSSTAGSSTAGSSTAGSSTAASMTAPTTVANAPTRPLDDPMRNRTMRPLVIAIDPGHGGQDPGAIGQSGKREKDVTLAIARELARQINATPGLKAYLTRDTDMFIPLNRRAQLARQARADMFVSIHADAAENRSANGSSVYVLSLKGASSQRARWLADKENASDLVGGVRLEPSSTLTSVLLDLTQSGQMKASEDAASSVLSGLGQLGRNHKPHVERANFAVLRTSDMPAMLVETAFISNPDEERRLTDPASQRQIARAVLEGVNTYFLRQPPPGTLYAARATADSSPRPGAGAGRP